MSKTRRDNEPKVSTGSNAGGIFTLSIRAKLLVLAGTLLVVLIASNLNMRFEIAAGSDPLQQQAHVQDRLRTATATLREFGEVKFWLADLQASWANESEELADTARAALAKHLKTLSEFAPKDSAAVGQHVEQFAKLNLEAVDAYIDKNRVLGNSLAAKAKIHINAVDKILVTLTKKIGAEAEAAKVSALSAANQAQTISLIVLAAAVGFAILLTLLILRSIINPIKAMVAAMTSLAAGNKETEVPVAKKDEIGSMALAVQVFKDNMIETERLQAEQREAEKKTLAEERQRETEAQEAEREGIKSRERDAAERQQRTEQIEALIAEFDQEVTTVLKSVATAADEMQISAKTMSETSDRTSQQATAVAAASEEATTNVQTVASAAEELSASIGEISRQVMQSNEMSQNAVAEAKLTNEKVEGLAEAAKKIGDVVSLINDIASQTNLLALNATIEAARAGEAGKGFAVVASEVKSLATQTGKATEEIGAHISAIQAATGDAVQAIQGIGATIGEIGEIATSVTSAVDEQGSATREIANSVQQAAAGTQEVSSNITQVTQAAAESQAVSAKMLEAATGLAQQGDVLRQHVDKFLGSVRAA